MDVKNLKLSDLISKPITVNPNTTLMKVREILLKNKVKRVIILEKKIPVGVITERDIAKKIYELGEKPITSVKAQEFIQKKIFVLTRENSVQECAKMMKKHRISLVIIVHNDKTLDGIVTKTDLVKAFLIKESTQIKISKIMKKEVVTAEPSDPILHVESLLIKYGISRVIIKRNQKP
ncbi:MAG: CBS domain-containing protein, partial [Nitrosopumilus sp.]|nr:CBS domain-containing protein [Nitrosopumilus sp.]